MRLLACLSIIAMTMSVSPVLAQDEAEPSSQQDRCQAHPDAKDNRGGTEPDNDDERNSTADVLEDCGGVLRPPPTGDREMTEPPPETGKTPVIRPEDLPGQQTPHEVALPAAWNQNGVGALALQSSTQ